MKNIKEYSDVFKGGKVADQILSVMKSDMDKSTLSDFPELQEWLENDASAVNVTDKLSSHGVLPKLCENFNREERGKETLRIVNSIRKKQQKTRFLRITSSIAAALVVLSFVLFYENKTETEKNSTGTMNVAIDKPMLILGNGKNVDLTETENYIENAIKTDDKLTYHPAETIDTAYNTLIVPKLYTYHIELCDGTVVCLNANSELRYPVQFHDEQREVFLKGEAYFNVSKNDKPFVVRVGEAVVKAYGTQFNINSYHTGSIQTVLVEGSVGVMVDAHETMMKPNQLLTIRPDGKVAVTNVDVAKYVAWREGEILCSHEPLSQLLEKLSTWYGVEFIYSDSIKNINITTSLSSDLSLEEVLNAIKTITKIKITKMNEQKYRIE